MPREEIDNSKSYQFSKAALEYYNEHHQDNDIDLIDAFKAGVEWADKTIIDKACKWLQKYFVEDHYGMSPSGFCVFVTMFRKAMEE